MDDRSIQLGMSLATVLFAIFAIVIFIYYGAGMVFYTLVAITIIIGLINAHMLSKEVANGEAAASVKSNPASSTVSSARRKRASKAKSS